MTMAALAVDSAACVPVPEPADGEDQLLWCVQVHQVTHDVRTFVFEADGLGLGLHEAGQYLVLSVEIDGETAERCYTISSPPTRPARVAVTVKREPGGLVSNWLHDNLRIGAQVSARGPYGTFSAACHPADRYLLLSGGSGATPMMSTLRAFFDLGHPVDVAYVHSARSPADILFRQELDWMSSIASTRPAMAVTHICERSAEDDHWSGATGRIDAEFVARTVPDIARREVFACGPAPYLAAVRQIVAALGVPGDCYHEETFIAAAQSAGSWRAVAPTPGPCPADQPASAAASASATAETFAVEFARSMRRVKCLPGTTVLAAAAQAGVPIPSSCGQGMCGTCKLTRLSGEVKMTHQGGIRAKEIAAGTILACCSVPATDVVLDA